MTDSKADLRRNELADLLADHLLDQGLNAASLRPLAKAAGLSDRMLIYYFDSRDAAIEAGLSRVAERMTEMLDASVSEDRLPAAALQAQINAIVLDPSLKPFMALWLELVARAAREEEPYATISAAIAAGFLEWTRMQLDAPETECEAAALQILAETEGLVLLSAAGLKITPRG